jgi:hypothetical protein
MTILNKLYRRMREEMTSITTKKGESQSACVVGKRNALQSDLGRFALSTTATTIGECWKLSNGSVKLLFALVCRRV